MGHIEQYYRLLLPVMGAVCMIAPELVAKWLPTILGGAMVLTSVTDTIFLIRERRYLTDHKSKASSLILLVMGICFLLGQESTIPLMGMTWGLLGLQEVNEEIEAILIKRSRRERCLVPCGLAGLKLALSLALLFEPIQKFRFHIFLLGLEIIAVTVREKNIEECVKAFRSKFRKR